MLAEVVASTPFVCVPLPPPPPPPPPTLQDLVAELKSELSGRLEQVVLGLMDPVPLFLARCLRKAMKVGEACCVCAQYAARECSACVNTDPVDGWSSAWAQVECPVLGYTLGLGWATGFSGMCLGIGCEVTSVGWCWH